MINIQIPFECARGHASPQNECGACSHELDVVVNQIQMYTTIQNMRALLLDIGLTNTLEGTPILYSCSAHESEWMAARDVLLGGEEDGLH